LHSIAYLAHHTLTVREVTAVLLLIANVLMHLKSLPNEETVRQHINGIFHVVMGVVASLVMRSAVSTKGRATAAPARPTIVLGDSVALYR
jgi:chromate transport protein ChrA